MPPRLDIWLSQSPRRRADLYAQVLAQDSGYRLTLLSLDGSESKDDDLAERHSAIV